MVRSLRCLPVAALAVIMMLSGGCATRDATGPGQEYARAYELARYNQILDREARQNLNPVYGLGGREAERSLERYERSFEKEPVRPVYNINVGTIR